jgi:1-acyl-sn-glycerol-3-phosphate acyltransferase
MLTRMGLYSIVFYLFFLVVAAVFFVGAVLLTLVTYPFDRNRKILHLYSCFWAQIYFHINPLWKMEVRGRNKLPWNGAAILAANHQSLGDILVLFGLYRPFKWVSKASVFKVPFLGWNMKLNGYVGLVRGNKESIAKMMAECRAWLDKGVPVLLFPEGTRSEDGEVKAFKDGAFRLAIESGHPIIPIAVVGSAATLPKHGFKVTLRSHCIVEVMDPVDPAPFKGDVAAMREHVRDLIIARKNVLEAERLGQVPSGVYAPQQSVR